jgi:D-alanyl-D-alanine endopeptidase (penicillin-binding protein 7)
MKYFLLSLLFFANSVQAGYALYDYNKHEYLDRTETEEVRSIASITKLFTALTIIRSNTDLDRIVAIQCQSRGRVQKGTELTIRDLLVASLVASDNCAAETLANTYSGGFRSFIFDRNQLINYMGLKNTNLHDATGLSVFNTSTINDLVAFGAIAYQNQILRSIAGMPEAKLTVWRKGRVTKLSIKNTNPAFLIHSDIALSKTGTTNAAGKCVLMVVKRFEELYAVVILGEPNSKSRNKKVEKLLAYNETTTR